MNKKNGLSLLLISLVSFVSAHAGEVDAGHYSMMIGHYGFGGMVFMWLIMLLFIAVLVLLVVWLAKQIMKK